MKMNYRKTLKFTTLLITALLIGAVSAATYKYLNLDGSVTVGTQKIVWVQGGSEIAGDTVTVSLSVEPGVPMDFNGTLYMKNKDTASHNLTVKVTTAVGSDFNYFYTYIYENFTTPGTWTLADDLNVKTLDDEYSTYTGNNPMQASGFYKLDFGLKTTTSATGTYDFDIQVKYE
jgi:hypothetical protein